MQARHELAPSGPEVRFCIEHRHCDRFVCRDRLALRDASVPAPASVDMRQPGAHFIDRVVVRERSSISFRVLECLCGKAVACLGDQRRDKGPVRVSSVTVTLPGANSGRFSRAGTAAIRHHRNSRLLIQGMELHGHLEQHWTAPCDQKSSVNAVNDPLPCMPDPEKQR